jgi:hypothetical protein
LGTDDIAKVAGVDDRFVPVVGEEPVAVFGEEPRR